MVVAASFLLLLCLSVTNAARRNETLVMDERAGNETCGVSPFQQQLTRYDIVSPEHRLVGGTEAEPHAWPWTGQVIADDRHQCGCTLIDEQFVLTAAHCFARSRNPYRYTVLLGGHYLYSGTIHRVQNISIHALYQTARASAYDLALLKIDPPAKLTETTALLCLPAAPPQPGKMCVVAGWGRQREHGERSKTLREIHVPVMAPGTCNNYRHYSGRLHLPSMFCAGYSSGKVDSCQGDSGGPLMCERGGRWELQGIVSWGIGCAQPGFPGIYTKVHSSLGWIKKTMETLRNE